MTLEERCLDAADDLWPADGDFPSDRAIAAKMEKVARQFAADTIRGMTAITGRPGIGPFPGQWRVIIGLPQADGLYGLGFGSEEEAKAWREKAIEMAVIAATGKR